MASEGRELVTEFSTLKAGMLVELEGCVWCGQGHRRMLTLPFHGVMYWPGGRELPAQRGWRGLPDIEHARIAVSEQAVAERRVYRIIDGIDEEADAALMRVVESGADLLAQGRMVRP